MEFETRPQEAAPAPVGKKSGGAKATAAFPAEATAKKIAAKLTSRTGSEHTVMAVPGGFQVVLAPPTPQEAPPAASVVSQVEVASSPAAPPQAPAEVVLAASPAAIAPELPKTQLPKPPKTKPVEALVTVDIAGAWIKGAYVYTPEIEGKARWFGLEDPTVSAATQVGTPDKLIVRLVCQRSALTSRGLGHLAAQAMPVT